MVDNRRLVLLVSDKDDKDDNSKPELPLRNQTSDPLRVRGPYLDSKRVRRRLVRLLNDPNAGPDDVLALKTRSEDKARNRIEASLPFRVHFDELGAHSLYVALRGRRPVGMIYAQYEESAFGIAAVVYFVTMTAYWPPAVHVKSSAEFVPFVSSFSTRDPSGPTIIR